MGFLETLGYVSIVSKRNEKRMTGYTASDFLDEWSGAFEQLNNEDLDKVKYDYLTRKYK